MESVQHHGQFCGALSSLQKEGNCSTCDLFLVSARETNRGLLKSMLEKLPVHQTLCDKPKKSELQGGSQCQQGGRQGSSALDSAPSLESRPSQALKPLLGCGPPKGNP